MGLIVKGPPFMSVLSGLARSIIGDEESLEVNAPGETPVVLHKSLAVGSALCFAASDCSFFLEGCELYL
jgi:hypothetical protein